MNIATNAEPLTLLHRDIIMESLSKINTDISEYSFANLFLFRKQHQYRVLADEKISILGKAYDGETYIMPLFEITDSTICYIDKLIDQFNVLFPVEERKLAVISRSAGLLEGSNEACREYDFYYHEGDSDYLYTREKMSHFPGRKLHKKRNLLKQFNNLYRAHQIKFSGINDFKRDDAMTILEGWQKDIGASRDETDYNECAEAFDLIEIMGLEGYIYYVDNEPGGFLIGEALNHHTHAIHFAKGRRKFKGLYQYMYSHFAKSLPESVEYINFEQDLGKLALKIAKSSYQPDMMLHKYRVKKL